MQNCFVSDLSCVYDDGSFHENVHVDVCELEVHFRYEYVNAYDFFFDKKFGKKTINPFSINKPKSGNSLFMPDQVVILFMFAVVTSFGIIWLATQIDIVR